MGVGLIVGNSDGLDTDGIDVRIVIAGTFVGISVGSDVVGSVVGMLEGSDDVGASVGLGVGAPLG